MAVIAVSGQLSCAQEFGFLMMIQLCWKVQSSLDKRIHTRQGPAEPFGAIHPAPFVHEGDNFESRKHRFSPKATGFFEGDRFLVWVVAA
jgi:hypothetical protein